MPGTTRDKTSERDSNEATTPGRPSDSSSRQQTHKNQRSQTGSPELDKEATRRTGTPAAPPKPPGAK